MEVQGTRGRAGALARTRVVPTRLPSCWEPPSLSMFVKARVHLQTRYHISSCSMATRGCDRTFWRVRWAGCRAISKQRESLPVLCSRYIILSCIQLVFRRLLQARAPSRRSLAPQLISLFPSCFMSTNVDGQQFNCWLSGTWPQVLNGLVAPRQSAIVRPYRACLPAFPCPCIPLHAAVCCCSC